ARARGQVLPAGVFPPTVPATWRELDSFTTAGSSGTCGHQVELPPRRHRVGPGSRPSPPRLPSHDRSCDPKWAPSEPGPSPPPPPSFSARAFSQFVAQCSLEKEIGGRPVFDDQGRGKLIGRRFPSSELHGPCSSSCQLDTDASRSRSLSRPR